MNHSLSLKKCPSCQESKTIDCYYINKRLKDGLSCYCKDCTKVKGRESKKRQYQKHGGLSPADRAWREKNKDKLNELQKKYAKNIRENYPERCLVRGAKHRAKHKKLDFDLKPEDISIPSTCPLLGIPLQKGVGRIHPGSPSLDRIDPSKGYIKGNVWVISYRANQIKNDASPRELIHIGNILSQIYPHIAV